MKIIRSATLVVILSFMSLSAQAMSVRWELSGTLFQGGTAGGSLLYDADTSIFLDINLFTSAGSPTGGLTFTQFAGEAFEGSLIFLQAGVLAGVSTTGLWLRDISLSDLTNAGGTLVISQGTSNDIAEVSCTAPCLSGGGGASNWRNSATNTLTGGTPIAVPEPGTLSLLVIGLAGIAWVRRRKIT